MAAAYSLARAGWRDVVILERGSELGGLAGTIQRGDYFYPLAYHHILPRDRTLRHFLGLIGALPSVRWRKIRMFFHLDGRNYDLGNPRDFLRFPMGLVDKTRFVAFMLRCFFKEDWSDWEDRSAAELVDAWASPGVRQALFEPLCRIKFDLTCEDTSGAWLGARLHAREGSAPLGYIPGCNWTKVLCDGVTRLLEESGVRIRLGVSVRGLRGRDDRITEAELEDGERISGDLFVSTLPTEVYRRVAPHDATAELAAVRYTAIISAMCVTEQRIRPEFYWMNLTSPEFRASGLFMLNGLNPTIGAPGEVCVNFMTHLPSRDHEFFRRSDEQLLADYFEDFRRVFGFELRPSWTRISRVPMYSPILVRGYRNPPVASATWSNVFFAGNYRTCPSPLSTGTALASGVEAARVILEQDGRSAGDPR
jgi:protoporphyrinogen oxidase